jgi:outer membrane protein OmpA-like peptidoglycan-associated protein
MLRQLAKFGIGLAAVTSLGMGSIYVAGEAGKVESKIANAAQMAVGESYPWAIVGADGQAVRLTGAPPSREEAEAARADALAAIGDGGLMNGGVTVVETAFDPAPPPLHAAPWRAEFDGATLVLSGAAPDLASRTQIEGEAAALFAPATLQDATQAGAEPAPDWTADALLALRALSHLDMGAVESRDGAFALSGQAADDAIAAAARATMSQIGGRYAQRADVSVPADVQATTIEDVIARETTSAPPEDFAACQRAVAEALMDGPIIFASRSSALTARASRKAEDLVRATEPCPSAVLAVDGHTDATGPEAMNATLSLQRAQAVASALTKAGIAPARIQVAGFGSSRPVASNGEETGRAKNRRIEITVSAPEDR